MPIINLTKMTIRLADEAGNVYREFEPAQGGDVRVHSTGQEIQEDGVPIEMTRITGVDGLPEAAEGTYYIVPQPVAHAVSRADLVTPDTGPNAIRDEKGDVYAVRRLYSVSSDG